MFWQSWYTKRILLCLLSLILIVPSSIGLGYFSKQSSPESVIKAMKIITNEMMTRLENNLDQQSNDISAFHSSLSSWHEAYGGELMIALADGTVVYDSRSTNNSSSKIYPRFELDFSLRYANNEDTPTYNLAFPIWNTDNNQLIGYAQFALPKSTVDAAISASVATFGTMKTFCLILLVIGLILLIFYMLSTFHHVSSQYVVPITNLKDYAEAILKGDYGQRAEWIIRNEAGQLYAVFDQMRDEIRALQLQQASHSKAHKELISNLSHDLKTPLTTMQAYVDSIREGVCPDLASAIPYLNVVHSNIQKMTILVDDLLLHSLRDLEQIAVHPTEQYSAEVLKPIIEYLTHYIETSGIICDSPSSYPNVLLAIDTTRIEQVLANMVANALKHTSIGDKITLRVEEAPEMHCLRIIIIDTGSGISPADMPFIFERYYQGQAAAASHQQQSPKQGVGLGLSICKHIVEAHGGSISFHSRLYEGTTFQITLPLS